VAMTWHFGYPPVFNIARIRWLLATSLAPAIQGEIQCRPSGFGRDRQPNRMQSPQRGWLLAWARDRGWLPVRAPSPSPSARAGHALISRPDCQDRPAPRTGAAACEAV
jgi:hypothetical protein